MGNIIEIEVLKKIIRETITKVLYEAFNDRSLFPARTTKQAAKIFGVSPWTIRSWHKQGLLKGRYQILSGRACRLMFSNRDLVEFWDQYFPSRPEDWSMSPNDPRTSKAEQLQRMLSSRKVFARRRLPKNG
jgi:hypothetical protein